MRNEFTAVVERDGRWYIAYSADMVGHKLGEFAPTRTFKAHGGDKKAATE